MREALYSILLSAVLAGCAWTPERTNPYDPNSPLFVDPPVPNTPPTIDALVIRTECVNFIAEDLCNIKLVAVIPDPDDNLNMDSVIVYITNPDDVVLYFGKLVYSPLDATWSLTKYETELDSSAEDYVGSLLTVIATDDSGATAMDTIRIPGMFTDYPTLNWPNGSDHCICPGIRDFSWNRWTGEGQLSAMELRFYYKNIEQSAALTTPVTVLNDTFQTVNADFRPADNDVSEFYGWRLFVTDQNGNTAGSASALFNYRETCTGACGP